MEALPARTWPASVNFKAQRSTACEAARDSATDDQRVCVQRITTTEWCPCTATSSSPPCSTPWRSTPIHPSATPCSCGWTTTRVMVAVSTLFTLTCAVQISHAFISVSQGWQALCLSLQLRRPGKRQVQRCVLEPKCNGKHSQQMHSEYYEGLTEELCVSCSLLQQHMLA